MDWAQLNQGPITLNPTKLLNSLSRATPHIEPSLSLSSPATARNLQRRRKRVYTATISGEPGRRRRRIGRRRLDPRAHASALCPLAQRRAPPSAAENDAAEIRRRRRRSLPTFGFGFSEKLLRVGEAILTRGSIEIVIVLSPLSLSVS